MAFITISRFAAKRGLLGLKQSLLIPQGAPALVSTCHSMLDLDYEEKNKRLQRPLSPHLSIYKPQITTILSISHRITGIAWSMYLVGFAGAALTASHDFNHYMTALDSMNLGSPTIAAMKFVIAFPMMYHTMNGVRHLCWDQGLNVTNKGVAVTGMVMLAATALATIVALLV